jgi:hypothetical protein
MMAGIESSNGKSDRPTSDRPDLAESVAGEEDPGAAIDLAGRDSMPGRSDQPAGRRDNKPQAPMSPGDEAPPGTAGTGENVCPRCGGSGKMAGGDCPECQGTGKVTVGIGGA